MNDCRCDEVTLDFRYCDEHHSYRDGTRQLASVSSVINSVLPQDFSGIDPAVLENARERGCQVDDIFCGVIDGSLKDYPIGTRDDSKALVEKLLAWWDSEKRGKPITQLIVRDGEIAGRFDFYCDDVLYDLKCVHTLRKTYPIQVAAYRALAWSGNPHLKIREVKLVHATERFKTPKLVTVPETAMDDWYTVRKAWELKRRLNGGAL